MKKVTVMHMFKDGLCKSNVPSCIIQGANLMIELLRSEKEADFNKREKSSGLCMGCIKGMFLNENLEFDMKTISRIKIELYKIPSMIGVVYFSTTAGL